MSAECQKCGYDLCPPDPCAYCKVDQERNLWRKLSKAQDKLLLAYRVAGRTPGKALDDIAKARAALAKLEEK